MASQIATTDTSRLAVVELNSFIGGYHAYKDTWTPFIGEGLLLRREPENVKNRSAVSVLKDGETVGHILFNIYNAVSRFLRIEFNKGFAEVTGEKVNRGAGYGLLYIQVLRATAFRYVRYFDHYSSSPKKYLTQTSSLCTVYIVFQDMSISKPKPLFRGRCIHFSEQLGDVLLEVKNM